MSDIRVDFEKWFLENIDETEGFELIDDIYYRNSSSQVAWRAYQEACGAKEREMSELREQIPSIENGKNRYGVDVSYFRNLINRELNRSLRDFRPDELARVFARASRTADPKVMHEDEFRLK